MRRAMLEIAANSLASALAAQEGGADRIELCVSLGDGGITPGLGLLEAVRSALHIPVHVLIRPRAGDFVYDATELAMMRRDIVACRETGCDGVVIGVLTPAGDVDTAACRTLMEVAVGLDVTFHRAIDASRDPLAALEQVIALGCARVLTSGAAASAEKGATLVRRMREHAAGRIGIMAGAGLTVANLAGVAIATGVEAFHASARIRRASRMHWQSRTLDGLPADHEESDAPTVRAMVAVLERVAAAAAER